jgi:hypothetical protein
MEQCWVKITPVDYQDQELRVLKTGTLEFDSGTVPDIEPVDPNFECTGGFDLT